MCPELNDWQPAANLQTLQLRSQVLANIRKFFAEKNIMEVETPILGRTTVTEPNIESVPVNIDGEQWFLQTSPEYYMKRLLCAGMGSIYQIAKVFRSGEVGINHNFEFTMLEWYQVGIDHRQLMVVCDGFLQQVFNCKPAKLISYAALFQEYLSINPHDVEPQQLQNLAADIGIDVTLSTASNLGCDDWLDILFTYEIQPKLISHPWFVYDYPKSQAALAKVEENVAHRFEVFINGLEVGNGYHELTNPIEQTARFERDLNKRAMQGKPLHAIDNRLIQALKSGMPNCAGIAIGIDRLLMGIYAKLSISEVVSFDYHGC